ncbi:BQ2448_7938 [Microbotryum intermedium]|uniref:BQ2448_7938 protein n=1 Tax=Microbotryum intermedium TaxID=269621 RepID=A0A238FQ59_9BASI|nr:BQ2448_7938 [Microbotryum intermedium]
MDSSSTLVEAGSPVVQYSRSTLLALYASPLVPDTLHGMKPLSEWYGEYQDPPSSPPTRARDAPASGAGGASSRAHNNGSSSSNHTSNPGSNLSGGRPNPFANFGRFGVDGGLDPGEVAGFLATKSSSGVADKRSRDGVPHLQRDGVGPGGRAGARRGEASIESTSPTKSSAFTNDRLRASTRAGGADERNGALGSSILGRREEQKKDRRAPDEGGWRSVGGLNDRDRRTGRGNDQPRDLRNDKRDRTDGFNSSTRGQRQPAWMDSDGPHSSSGSAPSWMDAPISSENFELGGRSLPPHDGERGGPSTGVAGAPEGGIDSIAAFKKQMKELERIKSGGDVEESKQPSESVFASLVKAPAQQESESQSSVLDSLRLGGEAPTVTDEGSAPRDGGRSSRFAKYFDGKPPASATSPNVQPQQAPSVFEALLGGGGGGASKGNNAAEASSKDAESMARLMGMLQFSSARATSPVNSKSSVPIASPSALPGSASAPMPSNPQPNGHRSRQTSGSGSRFAFSQPPLNAHPSAPSHVPGSMAPSQTHEHQPQPPPRSVSGSQPGAPQQPPHSPPRQNFNQATHSFALPPLGSPSTEARPSQPSSQQLHHHSAHSRAGSAQPLSPPVSANFELPPSAPQPSGGIPPPPPHFLQMLNGMQSPPSQQHVNGGVASRPLPPLNNGMPPQQGPSQQQQQQPIPGGPHQMPHFQSPPPPPPHHMGFGNSPMSPEIAAAHMRAMSNPSRSQAPPFNLPPPPFMYGGPPPPMGSMAPNMLPFPPQFRPPPPPPGAFSGAGVPDLMALLNSGGPRIGAASAPLPPRAPPMPQGQPQPQQQQQHQQHQSIRQFISPPPMNHGQ